MLKPRTWLLAIFLFAAFSFNPLWAQNGAPIRVGIYENPPKIFTDETGEVAGFYADITQAIMADQGWRYQFVPGTWQEGLERLERSEIDVMVDVAFSEERAQRFLFTEETVFINWGVIYHRPGLQISAFIDLQGLRVAGMDGGIHTEGSQGLLNMAKQFEIQIDYIAQPDYQSCFEAVSSGQADVAVVNRLFGLSAEADYPLVRSNVVFNPSALKYAFAPNSPRSPALIAGFDASLRRMKTEPNSPYQRALERYLPGFVQHRQRAPLWMKVLLPSLSLVLLFAVFFVVILARQIQARKRLEADLLTAKETAESANRAKSTFLANTSHEIRTPMNAVLGYAQILASDPQLNEAQLGYLQKIMAGGEHLLSIINSILDMSKIEAGHIKLEQKPFDIRASLQSVYDLLILKARSKGLDLTLQIDEELAAVYLGDEAKLRQILLNLLNNALKFTERGSISVQAQKSGDAADGQEILRILVSDTGRGIPAEDRQRIFEAFEQSSCGEHCSEGTGLGLAISRQLSRLMGGDLILQDQSVGSCFVCSVQLHPAPDSTAAELPGRALGLQTVAASGRRFIRLQKPCRLIIADDRESNLDILKQMLSPYGFTIQSAVNGQEAVDLYKANPAELVLLDYVMPYMDGLTALKAIRAYEAEQQRPASTIFIVSASTLEEEEAVCIAAGAQAFIRKPFKKEYLLTLIDRYIPFQTEEALPTSEQPQMQTQPQRMKELLDGADEQLREQLIRIVTVGDISALRELAREVAEEQPELAESLRQAALNFDFAGIKEALNEPD